MSEWTVDKLAGAAEDHSLAAVVSTPIEIAIGNRVKRSSDWSEEKENRLRSLFAGGSSMRAIARELGVSRNAVIGKVHRLGLSRAQPARPAVTRQARRKARQQATQAGRRAARSLVKSKLQPPSPTNENTQAQEREERDKAHVVFGPPRTLLNLQDDTCRWPIGHPGVADFFYCGAKTLENRPYCIGHCQWAYKPSRGVPRA